MSQYRTSLLVPFRGGKNKYRRKDWRWLKRYWRHELPGAEIVIGRDWGKPFSKTNAINDAASRATGDVFVIIDADCYISGRDISHCADRVRLAVAHGVRQWFIPYRHLYRLNRGATERLLDSNPRHPLRFPRPPDPSDIEHSTSSDYGHRYGALVMVIPREAFEIVHCMDPRFRGWGGEDVSFLRALDTLYVKHQNTPNQVLHLWHPRSGETWGARTWEGQDSSHANDWLAIQYNRATNKPAQMRKLVDDGCDQPKKGWFARLLSWLWQKVLIVWEAILRFLPF